MVHPSGGGAPAAGGVVVVMVPFPAQGHLNQLLHLSRLVADRGVGVHFVGSATHNRQAKVRLHGWDVGAFPNIRFHDLPVPRFATPRPDPDAPIRHLQPAFDASLQMQAPLASLLRTLSATSRRVVVVHDSLMSFAAQEAAALPNAESYVFHSVSAFAILLFQWGARGEHEEKLHALLPGVRSNPVDGCFTPEFIDFIHRQYRKTPPPAGRIFNTCRSVEGGIVDLLARDPLLHNTSCFAVGPLNPVVPAPSGPRHQCMEWLDRQPPGSVVYVAFGTTSSMPREQIVELAAGLERSRQRFLWVFRDADRGDIFAEEGEGDGGQRHLLLPSGYERRVAGVGMVVRGWAPQLDVLGHPSTGLFMSHCGWNSCMESLSAGVPMAAWPMHSDQPKNALLVTEVLKVGVAVRDWARREETVTSAAVEDAIRRVMDSEEGREIRTRTKAVRDAIHRAVSKGGCSHSAMESFVSHIIR
uniref:Glycosyltransferase n=1 Tax=Anthurium amnicola TaxID=1678845 RepID=A0A1D1XQB8_9ARAE